MNSKQKAEALQRGETIISREPGNSMTPILKSRQPVRLASVEVVDTDEGFSFIRFFTDKRQTGPMACEELLNQIVFCKVRGKYYTHLVKAYNPKRGFLIGNNHGHNNGWTWKIYGKVVETGNIDYKGE